MTPWDNPQFNFWPACRLILIFTRFVKLRTTFVFMSKRLLDTSETEFYMIFSLQNRQFMLNVEYKSQGQVKCTINYNELLMVCESCFARTEKTRKGIGHSY